MWGGYNIPVNIWENLVPRKSKLFYRIYSCKFHVDLIIKVIFMFIHMQFNYLIPRTISGSVRMKYYISTLYELNPKYARIYLHVHPLHFSFTGSRRSQVKVKRCSKGQRMMQFLVHVYHFFSGEIFLQISPEKKLFVFRVYLFFLQTVSVLPMSRDARASAPVRSSLTGDVLVGRVCFSGKNMSALSPKNTVPFISEKSKRA